MIAAIYARVSTDLQAEHGYSIGTQVDACRKAAAALGAETVLEFVDDGYSGAYLERPALESLREGLRAKTYDAVICYTPDRLARRLSHQLLITEEIERSGAALHFVSGEYKDTPEGRMFYQLQGAFSEYEREKIRERTMRGKRGKLREGVPICDSGVYGYDFVDGHYVVNAAEAEVIREIFRLYVHECVGGTAAVARLLTERGIPSPAGRPYWSAKGIRDVLLQQMYTGHYFSNRFGSKKTAAHSKHQFVRPEAEWIPMECPAIIDEDTFRAASSRLQTNRSCRKYQHGEIYLLQGILVCGVCGRQMRITNTGKKASRYYVCSGRRTMPSPDWKRCITRGGKTDAIDAAFWEALRDICSSVSELKRHTAPGKGPRTPEKEEIGINTRVTKIKADKAAIMEWMISGLITKEEATSRLSRLAAEESRLKAKKKECAVPQPSLDYKRIVNAVKNCPDDPAARRRVILSCIDRVYVTRADKKKKAKTYDLAFSIRFK